MKTITVPRKPSVLDITTGTVAALKALQRDGMVRVPSKPLRAYVAAQIVTHGLPYTLTRSTFRRDAP